METKVTTQEILVMHNSRFFSRELNEKEESTDRRRLSQKEQVAEACWNGLLKETLPELFSHLSLIQIDECRSFLDLKFGEYGSGIEKELSLNPYSFLENVHLS